MYGVKNVTKVLDKSTVVVEIDMNTKLYFLQ